MFRKNNINKNSIIIIIIMISLTQIYVAIEN
jgi:hypothetical protein